MHLALLPAQRVWQQVQARLPWHGRVVLHWECQGMQALKLLEAQLWQQSEPEMLR